MSLLPLIKGVNSFSLINIGDGSCDCNVGGVGVIALLPHLPSLITEAVTAEWWNVL